MNTIKTEKLTWIDIQKPNQESIDYLKDRFNLHPLILRELMPPSYRSKVEQYDKHLYLILYFPVFDKKTRQTKTRELDIVVYENTLITSHYLSILPIKSLFTRCNLYEEERKKYMNQGPALLLYHIINSLLTACLPKLDHIAQNIEKVEEQIFRGREKEMVTEISIIKRDILDMSKAIKAQRRVLASLSLTAAKFFGSQYQMYFQDLLDSYEYVRSILDNHQEIIESLEKTNESLLSNKISEIIKVLTVISFITFPLGVIVGIFGMNVFRNFAFVNKQATFWIILGSMAVLTLLMVGLFKKKKWL